MMRITARALALAFLAAACAPQAKEKPLVGEGCTQTVERVVAFTAPDARDRIEARAFGDRCADAVVVWTVRAESGKPLWSYAAPFGWFAAAADGDSAAAVAVFLERWASAPLDDTSAAPVWSADDAAAPEAWGPAGSSMFVRETYESIRAAKLPRLCVPISADAAQCIFFDAEAEAVDVLYSTGA